MGFPIMIIKNKKPKKEKEEKENKKEDENKIQEEEEEKDDDDNNNDDNEEKYTLFPKFGCQILEENKNADIFKYRGISKIYESHCILAQLFPCTDINLYAYPETIKKDQKLTEKERNDYIYKLLTMSLIGEGNYALFKYIYLTQSRFIKYNNLYEEILDILSNLNKCLILDNTIFLLFIYSSSNTIITLYPFFAYCLLLSFSSLRLLGISGT